MADQQGFATAGGGRQKTELKTGLGTGLKTGLKTRSKTRRGWLGGNGQTLSAAVLFWKSIESVSGADSVHLRGPKHTHTHSARQLRGGHTARMVRGTHCKDGLQSNIMALITSDCGSIALITSRWSTCMTTQPGGSGAGPESEVRPLLGDRYGLSR